MSNKLYSMLELANKGLPYNNFYALDPRGVSPDQMEPFLKDGLRNFRARVKTRSVVIRTGLAGKPETKLYIAINLDASNDELILNKMKEALIYFSKKHGGYKDCFIILQEWTEEEEFRYSLNLLPIKNEYIIEAVKGNHYKLDRDEQPPTTIKYGPKGINILKENLKPHELIDLKRQLRQLMNNYIFEDGCIYECSLLKDRASFYQIKRPGELYKNPLNKDDFYKKLRDNNLRHKNKIMKR